MKNKALKVGLSFFLLVGFVVYFYKDMIVYSYHTSGFSEISTKEFYDLYNNTEQNSLIVYFGRQTCPYCRDFVGELRRLSEESSTQIYYIDTENTESDSKLRELRNQLNIELVPSLIEVNTINKTFDFIDINELKNNEPHIK